MKLQRDCDGFSFEYMGEGKREGGTSDSEGLEEAGEEDVSGCSVGRVIIGWYEARL